MILRVQATQKTLFREFCQYRWFGELWSFDFMFLDMFDLAWGVATRFIFILVNCLLSLSPACSLSSTGFALSTRLDTMSLAKQMLSTSIL